MVKSSINQSSENTESVRQGRARRETDPADQARFPGSDLELLTELDGSMELPSNLLQDPRIQTVQRRNIASQIGYRQGNQFLVHVLQKPHAESLSEADLQRQVETDPEQAAKQEYLSQAYLPSEDGLDMQSATNIGGFNARYSPSGSELLIRLRVGINFFNGLIVDPFFGFILPGSPDFATAAVQVMNNFPDSAEREDFVRQNWQWTDDQIDSWTADYEQVAGESWGQQHYFTSQRWPDVNVNVRVQLDVHPGHQADDHCKATVYKVPEGYGGGTNEVVSTAGQPTGYTGTFTSSGITGSNNFLSYGLTFPTGSASVARAHGDNNDPGPEYLDKLIETFQRGTPTGGVPITITGHASSNGDPAFNQRISEQRANSVAEYLRSHGEMIAGYRIEATGVGDQGATEDEYWRRADIQVGSGEAQRTMVHETGHMLGLGDEYVVRGFITGGTGGVTGQTTAHNPQVEGMGGVDSSVYENNDNIMSLGNTVRAQDYATMLEALNRVAAPEHFVYGGWGPAPSVPPDLVNPYGEPTTPEAMTA